MEKETISFNGKVLDVDMEAFLSQHDVVYLTPAVDGYEGFPLGNGDIGTMAWTPLDRIHFQINKCDTWDDAPPEPFSAWEDEKFGESYTSLRGCGELRIEPGLPLFDWMYLEDFEGRLSLYRAEACWRAKGPLGEVNCRAFVAGEPPVLVVSYSDRLSEPVTRRIELCRWGSRVFEHWYSQIWRKSLLGPGGTKAGRDKDELWIEQPTRSLRFALFCKLVGAKALSKVIHSRAAIFELDTGDSCEFTLFLTVMTSEEASDPLAAARETVNIAAREGEKPIFKRHCEYWSDFWSKSFIDISEDYLENLWYINVYQVGSSSQGAYPPHFVGSLWKWNRDVCPWNHYYHWNQQSYTWPLHASGHPELIMPYCNWRLEGLPHAIEDAKRVHGCSGAFYADVANRRGYQASDTLRYNLTPGPQIAMDMWRHYQYTLDDEFLKKYAYPVMRQVIIFYLDYLKQEKDGQYHIPRSSPYESWLLCKDTTSDLSCIRQLFPAFLAAVEKINEDQELSQQVRQVLPRLAEYVTTTLPEGVSTAGKVEPGSKIMACGIDLHSDIPVHFWTKSPEGRECGYHVANAQLAPIFPAGLVGLDQKGTDEFTMLENTLRCFTAEARHGHAIILIAQARMGLRDLLRPALLAWPSYYQLFPQGLFCYFRRHYEEWMDDPYSPSEHTNVTYTNKVRILGSLEGESVELPTRPFAHMALEAGSILETAINEMLLQSYSGRIRVFPSIPEGWEGRFTLHAIGGFVVTSELSDGEVRYIAIESKFGQKCCVIKPWEGNEPVRVRDLSTNLVIITSFSLQELSFATEPGHIYLIEREKRPFSSFRQKRISGSPNKGPKQLGEATLGKPRQF